MLTNPSDNKLSRCHERREQRSEFNSGNHFQNARTANWSVLPRPEPETDVVIITKNSTWLTKGTKHVVTNNCGGCNVLLTLPPPPLICCREPVSKTWLSSYLHNLGISWENSWMFQAGGDGSEFKHLHCLGQQSHQILLVLLRFGF